MLRYTRLTNDCRTADEFLNLTLDLEHVYVSSHHPLPSCLSAALAQREGSPGFSSLDSELPAYLNNHVPR